MTFVLQAAGTKRDTLVLRRSRDSKCDDVSGWQSDISRTPYVGDDIG